MAARYDRLSSDDLRMLWGATNIRGADHVAWAKAAAECDQDPWATVDHRSKETMEEEEAHHQTRTSSGCLD